MTARKLKSLALIVLVLPGAAFGQDHGHGASPSPYAGLESRMIKSLSAQDIEELQRGGGWGLALPAELNGRPGPAHLLELQNELELSADQIKAITAIFDDMRKDAIAAGERFIAAEANLSDAFLKPDLSEKELLTLVTETAEARAALRFIHLSRHLTTPNLLSAVQIRKYNILRGYADDPCANIPEGHDPEMWRRHNGCG